MSQPSDTNYVTVATAKLRMLIRSNEELKLCRAGTVNLVTTVDILRAENSNKDSVISVSQQIEMGLRNIITDKDGQIKQLQNSIGVSAKYITETQSRMKFWKRRTFEVAGIGIATSATLFYFLIKK